MKRKFFLLLFISSILMVSVFMSYSYGFFKKKMEITDFTLKVGNLAYQIDKNQIYIMPLEVQIVEFTITSQNEIESKYELYYQTDSKDISVGYVENTKALPTGTIKSNESKTVQIKISNGSNAHQIVYFGVEGGFIQNTIELTQGKKITEKRAKDTFDLIFNHPGENCKTYNDGTDTFLVGKCRTNYVWYSGKLWRVIKKNNTTGAIKMITENAVTTMSSNAENQPTFIDSYTDQWLQQEFLPTLHDYEDFLVVDSVWDITTNSSDTPTKPTGTTTVKRAVGLLNSYEYYTTYNNSSGLATSSNNYLVSKSYWSLITPYNETKIRSVLENGTLSTATPQDGLTIRPVINLKPDIQIVTGRGTETAPFLILGDRQETIRGTTLLNTRYSGEYLTFNNALYRIVPVENNLTKITSVNKPTALATSKFHSTLNMPNFENSSIKLELENYYQNLSASTKNMIEQNSPWYFGAVRDGINYKAGICKTVNQNIDISTCERTTATTLANIGLLRTGEMFASLISRENSDYFF